MLDSKFSIQAHQPVTFILITFVPNHKLTFKLSKHGQIYFQKSTIYSDLQYFRIFNNSEKIESCKHLFVEGFRGKLSGPKLNFGR